MVVHEMKQGDTEPAIRVQLFNGDGTNPDVSGKAVTFRMAATPHEPIIDDAACIIINGPAGIVEYQWQAGTTDNAGHFDGEFVVDGIRTYPSGEEYAKIIIGSRLD